MKYFVLIPWFLHSAVMVAQADGGCFHSNGGGGDDDDDGPNEAIRASNTPCPTSSTPSADSSQRTSHTGLSGGAIAGIAIGAISFIIMILALLLWRRRRNARRTAVERGDIDPQPSKQPHMRMVDEPLLPTSMLSSSALVSGHRNLPPPEDKPLPMQPASSSFAPSSYSAPSSRSHVTYPTPLPSEYTDTSATEPSTSSSRPRSSIRSAAPSELHSSMAAYQKDLRDAHRRESVDAADPPPSYDTVELV